VTEPTYVIAHVHEALATDPRVLEQGIEMTVAGTTLVLTGRVGSAARRDAAGEVAREHAPGFDIRNDLEVVDVTSPPAAPEHLQ